MFEIWMMKKKRIFTTHYYNKNIYHFYYMLTAQNEVRTHDLRLIRPTL